MGTSITCASYEQSNQWYWIRPWHCVGQYWSMLDDTKWQAGFCAIYSFELLLTLIVFLMNECKWKRKDSFTKFMLWSFLVGNTFLVIGYSILVASRNMDEYSPEYQLRYDVTSQILQFGALPFVFAHLIFALQNDRSSRILPWQLQDLANRIEF